MEDDKVHGHVHTGLPSPDIAPRAEKMKKNTFLVRKISSSTQKAERNEQSYHWRNLKAPEVWVGPGVELINSITCGPRRLNKKQKRMRKHWRVPLD